MSIDQINGSRQLETVSTPSSTPGSDGSEASGSLLPSVITASTSGGDPGAALAALMVKIGQAQKDSANQERKVADQTQDTEESQQVDLMRQKASELSVGAWVSGSIALASSAATFVGVGTMNVGAGGTLDPTKLTKWLDASSKALDAGSKLAGSLSSASVAGTEADTTQAQHAADHAKRASDDAKTDTDDAQKYMDKVLDFYTQYETAQSQATQAALHRS